MPLRKHIPKCLLVCLLTILLPVCSCRWASLPPSAPQTGDRYQQVLDEGHTLYLNRRHSQAIELFEKAGLVAPGQPEWMVAKAKALFATDRFSEAADLCRRALKTTPDLFEAVSLKWAAELEAQGMSDEIQKSVRSEIQSVIEGHGEEIRALLAAHDGFAYLDDKAAKRKLMYELSQRAEGAGKELRREIGNRLFEEIIYARSVPDEQILLMEAFIADFPDRRFADLIVFRWLQKKQATAEGEIDSEAIVSSVIERHPQSPHLKAGAARFLIEENTLCHVAAELIRQSLETRKRIADEKPPHFTEAMWEEVYDRKTAYWRYLLGRALLQAGEIESARRELETAAGNHRNWSGVYHYLGEIALAKNRLQQAISYYRRALEIEPRPHDTLPRLKTLLAEQKDYQGDPALYFTLEQNGVYYTDVTETAGLSGVAAKRVAWGDYNNDGHPDLLLDGRYLFANRGDGTFHDISEFVGLAGGSQTNGGIWADYDNDGDLDIFASAHGPNRLFENKGDGTFTDITDTAFPCPVEGLRTEAVSFGDLDNDGFLDFYAANYERKGVMRALGSHDRLYRNNGDGTFSNVSLEAGVTSEEAMCGRGVTWSDVNHDGYQDIVVANYRLDPNLLWINNGGQGFTEQSETRGIRGRMTEGAFGHSIGPASGDINNDLLTDLFITNLSHPRYIQYSDQNMLLINQGPPFHGYMDRFETSGIAFEETNSDPGLADVDNDGDLDLYMTSIYPGRYSHMYLNDGDGHFTDVSWQTRTRVENSWGAAFADYDNDGWTDLLVAGVAGVHLLRNNGCRNNWIKVIVRDAGCNRFGVGSRVRVSYGAREQTRTIAAGRGTGSQDGNAVIFGLGAFTGPYTIECRSRCGGRSVIEFQKPNQTVVLELR